MKSNEFYLAMFPFGDAPGMKLRPVLTLTDSVGPVPEVLVAYISSVIPSITLPTDLLLDPNSPDCKSTHLKSVSVLRMHKLATIHVKSLVRRLGSLSPAMSHQTSLRLRHLLKL